MTPFLVVGYGSELRGDDAVGRLVARCVNGWGRHDVRALAVHQLTPELAEPLSEAEVVVFVDACADDGADLVRLRRLEAAPGAAPGHTSDPRWLLALTEALYGRRPEAWLVTVPAHNFDLCEGLSSAAKNGAAVALWEIYRLVRARNRELGALADA
jgi:hydrogenase maturation protease